jgi:hypothetical protein
VLIDTNFINFSLQNKIELVAGMMDCLFAKCERPYPLFVTVKTQYCLFPALTVVLFFVHS